MRNGKKWIVAALLLVASFAAFPVVGTASAEGRKGYLTEFTYHPTIEQTDEIKVWKGDEDGDQVFEGQSDDSSKDEGWSGKH